MANHDLAWTAPQPFWTSPSGTVQDALRQPQILRFASDDFIPQVDEVLTVGQFYELAGGGQIIFT